jgi:hypothetical protein
LLSSHLLERSLLGLFLFTLSLCETVLTLSRHWELPVAAAVATTTATTTTTTTTALGLSASFAHVECSAVEVLAVEAVDRSAGGVVGHSDEGEAAGAAGFAIGDDRDVLYFAVLGECVAESIFGCIKAGVAYVEFQG